MDLDAIQDLRSRLTSRPQDADALAPALAKVLSRWRAMKPPGQRESGADEERDGLEGDAQDPQGDLPLELDPGEKGKATETLRQAPTPAAPFPPGVVRPTFGQRVHIAFDEAAPLLLTDGEKAAPTPRSPTPPSRQPDLFAAPPPARRRLDLRPPADVDADASKTISVAAPSPPRRGRLLFTALAEEPVETTQTHTVVRDVKELPARLVAEQDMLNARLASVRLRLGLGAETGR